MNAPVSELRWHSPDQPPFRLAGFAWYATDRRYRRMPLHPPQPLPDAVDMLANHTAGGQIKFQTDSPRLSVRAKLVGPADMDHMPCTGQCGVDCYLGMPRRQRFCSVTRFGQRDAAYECIMFDALPRELRNVVLNLPLYMGVQELAVGLAPDARVLPPPPPAIGRPAVFYGTSITQGGCASRPGMAYTNILSRRLNVEIVNLGFSGSGRGEPEVARSVALVGQPAAFVLDYAPNTDGPEHLAKTFPTFVRILRESHPSVPILALSRIRFSHDVFEPGWEKHRVGFEAMLRNAVAELQEAGDRQVSFHSMADALGDDFDECTVDGVHPTDLGFLHMADALEPVMRRLLEL